MIDTHSIVYDRIYVGTYHGLGHRHLHRAPTSVQKLLLSLSYEIFFQTRFVHRSTINTLLKMMSLRTLARPTLKTEAKRTTIARMSYT